MPNDKLRVVAMGVVALVWFSLPATALAWIYPEHRDIAVGAVESLDPARRAVFDRLWRDARLAHGCACASRVRTPSRGCRPRASTGLRCPRSRAIIRARARTYRGRPRVGLDPVGRRCRRAAQARSVTDRRSPTDPAGPVEQGCDRGYAASHSDEGPAPHGSTRCGRGPPAPTRRSPICDPGRLQQRPLSAPSPVHRHVRSGLRGAHDSAWFRHQRDRGLCVVSPQRHGEGHAARQ